MKIWTLISVFSQIVLSQTNQGTHSTSLDSILEKQLATLNSVSNPTSRFYNQLNKLIFGIGSCSESHLFAGHDPSKTSIDYVLGKAADNLCHYLSTYAEANNIVMNNLSANCLIMEDTECSLEQIQKHARNFIIELSRNEFLVEQLRAIFDNLKSSHCEIDGESRYETFIHVLSGFADYEPSITEVHYLYPYIHDHSGNIQRYGEVLKGRQDVVQ